jgi:uncharacterized protein DUF5615
LRILLDENFPIQLYRKLRESGHHTEHIIVSGERGLPDFEIRECLVAEAELIFLTQDIEFEDPRTDYLATVLISRVRQSLPIQERVQLWFEAIESFLEIGPKGKVFNLLESGVIVAVEKP